MTSEFSGRRYLVTGVGSGIGQAVALKLAALGAEVHGISKTQKHLDELKSHCQEIHTYCQDIQDWEATRQLVDSLPVMDGVVNSAGAGDQALFQDTTPELLDM